MNQSKNWCFTDFKMHNWKQIWEEDQENAQEIRFICAGVETCPSTGRKHIQGWLQLWNKKRLGGVKKLLNDKSIHLEACRGSEYDNEKYCKKGGQWWSAGKFIKQGQRVDLEHIHAQIQEGANVSDIMNEHPTMYCKYRNGIKDMVQDVQCKRAKEFRHVEVTVLEGPTGVGKTRKAYEETDFMIHGNRMEWWDGYNGEESICIDEFANSVKITDMLRLLDGYRCRLDVKGSFTYAMWKKVYITTNLEWDKWYPAAEPAHRDALRRRLTHWITME